MTSLAGALRGAGRCTGVSGVLGSDRKVEELRKQLCQQEKGHSQQCSPLQWAWQLTFLQVSARVISLKFWMCSLCHQQGRPPCLPSGLLSLAPAVPSSCLPLPSPALHSAQPWEAALPPALLLNSLLLLLTPLISLVSLLPHMIIFLSGTETDSYKTWAFQKVLSSFNSQTPARSAWQLTHLPSRPPSLPPAPRSAEMSSRPRACWLAGCPRLSCSLPAKCSPGDLSRGPPVTVARKLVSPKA